MIATEFIDKEFSEFFIKDGIITGKPLKEDLGTEGVAKTILNNLNNFPDFVGQINVHTGEKTTFAQFKDRSIRCALWLKKQGIGKNDVVSTSVPLHNDDYVPFLATLFIGATFNPLNYRLTLPEARHFFDAVQPKVMFAWDEGIDLLVSAAKETGVDCTFIVFGKHPNYLSLNDLMAEQSQEEIDEFRLVEPEEPKKQVGAIFFSSGSTGNPKGIMLSYETLKNKRTKYGFTRSHLNVLSYSPFSWITGTLRFVSCIVNRSTRILHLKLHAEETGAVVEKYQVNLIFLTPSMINELCNSNTFEKYNFSQVQNIRISGYKTRKAVFEAARKALPNTFVGNVFGMTESGTLLAHQTRDCKKIDSIGYVPKGVSLKIVDPDSGRVLGHNQEGELCFKFDNMMIGYLKDPEETKKTIDDDGWLHTGDLGFYDENGEISITDRIKNVIRVQNCRVFPYQIEEILLQHPDVADAAVISVPHEVDIERPLAFVVKKPGAKVSAEELAELPTRYNENFRLSGGVFFIDEVPYMSNEKRWTKLLKEMAQAHIEK